MSNDQEVIKKIAVVIPCYNEEQSIAKVIEKLPRECLARHSFSLEVYVIDNNSTDNTAAAAKKAGATVITELQQGKGNAIRTGFAALPDDIDYVAMLDGDDTYSSKELLRMVEPLRSDFCDVVVGSRLGGHIDNQAMTTVNRFGNWLFTNAVRTIYHANITDVLTGYFAWKKPALDKLHPHLKSNGFAIEMEMVTKMARLKQRLASVPISYHPRDGESKLHPLRDGIRIAKMFVKNLTWRVHHTPLGPHTKKVVFVSDSIYPYMLGGKEKRLHEISKRLAGMGYDVHVYTMHWWKEPQKTRVADGVTFHAICRRHPMYSGDKRSIAESLLFGLACFKLLFVKFDVLDVDHMPFLPILSSWAVCTLRGRKFYGTWHEALSTQEWKNYMGTSGLIAAFIERISIKLPHAITVASEHTREQLGSIHGRVERVGLVASGIDTNLINSIEPADVDCDVLCVTRFAKDKGVDVLINAIGKVSESKPNIKCIIIGQGVERSNLEGLVSGLGLQDNIQFISPAPATAEVYSYMKAAKVFCTAAVRETFGIDSLEALGCGTPVVTTNCAANAARHLIQNGLNGSIVDPKPDALAGAILRWVSVVQKPDTSYQVAEHGWDKLARKQTEVYML